MDVRGGGCAPGWARGAFASSVSPGLPAHVTTRGEGPIPADGWAHESHFAYIEHKQEESVPSDKRAVRGGEPRSRCPPRRQPGHQPIRALPALSSRPPTRRNEKPPGFIRGRSHGASLSVCRVAGGGLSRRESSPSLFGLMYTRVRRPGRYRARAGRSPRSGCNGRDGTRRARRRLAGDCRDEVVPCATGDDLRQRGGADVPSGHHAAGHHAPGHVAGRQDGGAPLTVVRQYIENQQRPTRPPPRRRRKLRRFAPPYQGCASPPP